MLKELPALTETGSKAVTPGADAGAFAEGKVAKPLTAGAAGAAALKTEKGVCPTDATGEPPPGNTFTLVAGAITGAPAPLGMPDT